MATNARKTMNVGPALPLSWKWSVQETLSMDVEESTVQAGSPAPSGAAAPKRSRKKKLKFDDSPRESLGRVFSRIAGGQEVSEERHTKVRAVSKLEHLKDEDWQASREEWIEERELFAPGCGEFDFEDEKVAPLNVTVPSKPKNVRGEGPTLADLGISLPICNQLAPPLSPHLARLALPQTPATRPAAMTPATAPAAAREKRKLDIEDIFS